MRSTRSRRGRGGTLLKPASGAPAKQPRGLTAQGIGLYTLTLTRLRAVRLQIRARIEAMEEQMSQPEVAAQMQQMQALMANPEIMARMAELRVSATRA